MLFHCGGHGGFFLSESISLMTFILSSVLVVEIVLCVFLYLLQHWLGGCELAQCVLIGKCSYFFVHVKI